MIQNGYTYYQYATILVVKIIIESNEFHALKYMLNLSIRLGCKTYKQGHCYTGFKVYDQHMSSILKYLLTVPRRFFFCGSFMFLFCLVFAMAL